MPDTDVTQRAFIVDDVVLSKVGKSRKRRQKAKGKKPGGPRAKRMPKTAERNCTVCGLDADSRNPKMEPVGQGQLKIAIVGSSPDANADRRGRPLVGQSERLLQSCLSEFGIDLERDCIVTNAFHCLPPLDKKKRTKPKMKLWTDCCRKRLEAQLTEFQPNLILALGAEAMRAVLRPSFEDPSSNKYRGLVIPSVKYNCWVGCCWHPGYLSGKNADKLLDLYVDDIGTSLSFLDRPVPSLLPENHYILSDKDDAIAFLKDLSLSKLDTAFDFETNMIRPYSSDARVHCCSFSDNVDEGFFLPLEFRDYWTEDELVEIMEALGVWVESECPKVVQNLSMEESWCDVKLFSSIKNLKNDTMVTNHCIMNRVKSNSLEFQSFRLRGVDYKNEIDVKKPGWADKEPEDKIVKYSCLDSQYTLLSHQDQELFLKENPDVAVGAKFFIDSYPSLVNMEKRGFKVDQPLLAKQTEEAHTKQKLAKEFLENSAFVDKFRSHTGRETWGPGSDKDFIDMFYGTLSLAPPPWQTKGGSLPADKLAVAHMLKTIEDPQLKTFCDEMMRWRKLDTLITTFLGGFERAVCEDGLIHPNLFLHTVASYRSSGANPNPQNLPKRDSEHAAFRNLVIPRFDGISEIDAGGSEVATIAMLSTDPVLGKQVQQGFDPHTYWASKLFQVTEDNVSKIQRFLTKNKFIFPEFYGSWYKTCAKDLNLPEKHVKKVEEEFWRMYKVAKQWQDTLVSFYERHGYINMPMGFRRYAPLSKNQILNTPVQGTSFHMLLDSCKEADRRMIEKGMRSLMILEVHDSIVTDFVAEEVEDVRRIQWEEMTKKQFAWQGDVPRKAEWLQGKNWGDQKEIKVA